MLTDVCADEVTDVPFGDDGAWHEAAVDAAAAAELTSGIADRRFALAMDVRRDGMASFLARFLQLVADEGHAVP